MEGRGLGRGLETKSERKGEVKRPGEGEGWNKRV